MNRWKGRGIVIHRQMDGDGRFVTFNLGEDQISISFSPEHTEEMIVGRIKHSIFQKIFGISSGHDTADKLREAGFPDGFYEQFLKECVITLL